jgi:C4-type Zn-finger protein
MRGFGAQDALDCPHCKGGSCMFVARRTPHPERRDYELQTFRCATCGRAIERAVDRDGNPPRYGLGQAKG